MPPTWYELQHLIAPPPDLEVDVCVPAGSPWFDGHFPGDPILPGVAQLALVLALINDHFSPDLALFALKRVRFRQIVRPESVLNIRITLNHNLAAGFNFTVTCQNQAVCNGVLIMKATPHPGKDVGHDRRE